MTELLTLDLLCVVMSAGLAVLKIGGAIDWSWRWVLIPLWVGLAIGLASLILLIAADEGYVDLDRSAKADRLCGEAFGCSGEGMRDVPPSPRPDGGGCPAVGTGRIMANLHAETWRCASLAQPLKPMIAARGGPPAHEGETIMTTVDIEERLAELDEAVAELKALTTEGETGSDASFALSERQRELESEQEKLRVVLRRVGERS